VFAVAVTRIVERVLSRRCWKLVKEVESERGKTRDAGGDYAERDLGARPELREGRCDCSRQVSVSSAH
jgi:hypothetical protein